LTQPYTQRLSRRFPGLFIILIDQSGSMSETIPSQQDVTKADYAATALNEVIYAMIRQGRYDPATGLPRKYAYLSIFGYGSAVNSLLTPNGAPIDIAFMSGHPLRYETREKDEFDQFTNAWVRNSERVPIWIEPRAEGQTEMAQALTRARDVIRTWLNSPPEAGQGQRREGFPPIVINITDGQHQGSGDPLVAAREVMAEQTACGNVLLYNCHFTRDMNNPTVFPASVDQVASLNPFAPTLFEMSSAIPDNLRKKAEEINSGRPVPPGARGMVYNSDAGMLVRFLTWGTVGTTGVEA
jgi:uncharacterized protein YegL